MPLSQREIKQRYANQYGAALAGTASGGGVEKNSQRWDTPLAASAKAWDTQLPPPVIGGAGEKLDQYARTWDNQLRQAYTGLPDIGAATFNRDLSEAWAAPPQNSTDVWRTLSGTLSPLYSQELQKKMLGYTDANGNWLPGSLEQAAAGIIGGAPLNLETFSNALRSLEPFSRVASDPDEAARQFELAIARMSNQNKLLQQYYDALSKGYSMAPDSYEEYAIQRRLLEQAV